MAAWTDEATATATFSSGTLDLKLKQLSGGTPADSVSFTSLGMSNMYPGASKAAVIEVNNSGTLPLAYTLTGSAADTVGAGLGAALKVGIYPGGAPATSGTTCSGSLLGTEGALSGAIIAPEQARTLVAGAKEQLCVRVTLPAGVENSLQGSNTTVTLTFLGSQAQ